VHVARLVVRRAQPTDDDLGALGELLVRQAFELLLVVAVPAPRRR
jgi:hypothetical protein